MNRRAFLLSAVALPACGPTSINPKTMKFKNLPKALTIVSTRPPGKFVTPPPHCDVVAKHPQLLPLQSAALRLHPRKHLGLPVGASKIGGVFLANGPEHWPNCAEHDTFYIGCVQLTKQEFPEMPWPDQKDLFQLFLCPFDHDDGAYCPAVVAKWSSTLETVAQHPANPPNKPPTASYEPVECEFHPEPVIEYPDRWALSEALTTEIGLDSTLRPKFPQWLKEMKGEEDEDVNLTAYGWFLGCAPGTKIGGHFHWVQDPEPINCPKCNQPTELLITLASWEWDGGDYHRWKPDPLSRAKAEALGNGGDDHGMMFGDAGDIYVGVCRACPGWPVARQMQCS